MTKFVKQKCGENRRVLERAEVATVWAHRKYG